MLAGKQAQVSRLAECVPEDHLFVRFGSVGKLLSMRTLFDDWYTYGMGQARGTDRNTGVIDSLKKQWLIDTNELLERLYDSAFGEVAIASSDLFFREGTDATLIMLLKQPIVARLALDQSRSLLAKQDPNARIVRSDFLGIPFTHVTKPDRSIHVYVADPADDLHIRANSRIAFERIVRTILNQPSEGGEIYRLSDSTEFKYVRTLMPLDAPEEDGLVYLSDPFIRNLIGPEKKLTQRNRLVCRSRSQMIQNSQLLFLTQHGRDAKSIEELRSSGCLGHDHATMELDCPSGGQYSLTDQRCGCLCSHHGHPDAMVPTCEIPVNRVSKEQAHEYKQFVDEYSRYWRTFFDPIAIRLQIQPNSTRVETIVLPLIDNSVYQSLAASLGGEPEQLDSIPVPDNNIASLAFRLDKQRLLKTLGIPRPETTTETETEDNTLNVTTKVSDNVRVAENLSILGLAIHNYYSVFKQLPPQANDFQQGLPGQGMTRFVLPPHAETLNTGGESGTRFQTVTDGVSNTIMMVLADSNRAVTWTQPDDLQINLESPRKGWAEGKDQRREVGANVSGRRLTRGGIH